MPLLAALFAAGALTFAQARELADRRNPALAAARARQDAARAGIEAARQLTNPTLSVTYGPDDPRFTAGLDLKLPVLGQRGAAIRTAEASAAVAEAELNGQRSKLHAAVRRAYFALAAAQAQAALAGEAAQVAGAAERLAQDRYRTGTAPLLEVEQASLARKRADREQEDRRAEVAATRVELAALVGGAAPGVEAGALELVPSMPALDELLLRAQAHPELESLRRQEGVALARADEERTAVRPLPTVSVIAERLAGQAGFGLRGGVAFDVPLLSWNRGRVHEQEQTARGVGEQVRAARLRLDGQVRAARARWQAATDRARFTSGELVDSSRRVLEMAQAGYRIGRTSLINVLQAQGDLASARSKAVDAALEAQRAVADLEEATGADL